MDLELRCGQTGQAKGSIEVSESNFGKEYNEALVHQVVTAYLSGARQGTKAQKTRSEVRGGGAKPWRQKGTGRARAGTIRSPLWRSGGTTFAARPGRNYAQKVNKKMYRAAIRSIFSELVRQERLVVVEDFNLEEIKTATLIKRLNELNVENALIITDMLEKNLYLSARNIPKVDVIDASAIDPVALIAHEKVVVTAAAVKQLEEMMA